MKIYMIRWWVKQGEEKLPEEEYFLAEIEKSVK